VGRVSKRTAIARLQNLKGRRHVQSISRGHLADFDHRIAAAAELVHRTAGFADFLEAMMNLRYREQYEDAVSVYLRAQETAGLDICTDGDAHFDEQISGMSWQSYPLTHMAGFSNTAEPSAYQLNTGAPRGHILHDFLEARVLPKIVGPVGPGNLQYAAMWRVAQRLTKKPVKFGTILPELLAASVSDEYYTDPVERVWALSDALNRELGELADAGCR
jgi:5-methyltetrahydropteroyltriglutamate--homocysteine methyltransferase